MEILIVYLTALGVGGATVLGGIFGFIFKRITEKHGNTVLSFAAGVMLSTSAFNLILPALSHTNKMSELLSVFGILCGSICVSVLDCLVKKMILSFEKNINYTDKNYEHLNKILLFVAAIAIHNFPEGIAAGVGFGTGDTADALTVAGSIALQNLPEGMIVIAPMLSIGISSPKTMLIALMTAVSEIAGTLFGYYTVSVSNEILPFMLSFAGGTMLYVICSDMIPETQSSYNKKSVSYALIFGFCLMIIIDRIIN